MNKEKDIAELRKKGDAIMKTFADQYEALARRSEKLYDEQEALRKEYEALDAQTGMNDLYAEMARVQGRE